MKTATVNARTKKSGALICSALLGTIVTVAQPANADPTVIAIAGLWGNGQAGVYTAIQGAHTFGGPATVMPGIFAPQFTVSATSGLSNRPGWEYELVLDFNNFGLFNNPPNIWWDTVLNIKPPGTPNPITDFEVKNAAGAVLNTIDMGSTDGTIRIRNLIADFDLASDDKLIIQWNQGEVPAPGALALLGLAGAVGSRRRRRA